MRFRGNGGREESPHWSGHILSFERGNLKDELGVRASKYPRNVSGIHLLFGPALNEPHTRLPSPEYVL